MVVSMGDSDPEVEDASMDILDIREVIETAVPGDMVVFNGREEPYRVIAIEEREGLPMTLDHTDPRPWTKTLKLLGPGADRRDEPRWLIRYTAGSGREEPRCKLRYRRRDATDGEILYPGEWTGHGDVEFLSIVEEEEPPERDPETGVYLEVLEDCPGCEARTDKEAIGGVIEDPSEVGVSARMRVMWMRCRECKREWHEAHPKEYEEDLSEFAVGE